MYQVTWNLPRDDYQERVLPPGDYKITVTGLSGGEFISIDGWGGADWVVLVAAMDATYSGKIGGGTITVPASGRLKCLLSGTGNTSACKVRISK